MRNLKCRSYRVKLLISNGRGKARARRRHIRPWRERERTAKATLSSAVEGLRCQGRSSTGAVSRRPLRRSRIVSAINTNLALAARRRPLKQETNVPRDGTCAQSADVTPGNTEPRTTNEMWPGALLRNWPSAPPGARQRHCECQEHYTSRLGRRLALGSRLHLPPSRM